MDVEANKSASKELEREEAKSLVTFFLGIELVLVVL
jgi:hypothetical protein